jgi:uncharacterized SAM-binding protein YcdF (DUF218 family)
MCEIGICTFQCYNDAMVRRLVRGLLTLIFLVVLAAAIVILYIAWGVNHTGLRDGAQQADVIVILGARVETDGRAGPDLWVRTLHAVSLFQRGLAPYIICTGGYQNDKLSAAAVARDLAISRGVPADKILLADGSMTTGEDAVRTRDLMRAHGWQTALLVSHPLHLQRARILFEAQGLTIYSSPTSTDLEAIPWRTRAWLTARETVGILWITLEDMGLPPEWTTPLSHLVYGPDPSLGAE